MKFLFQVKAATGDIREGTIEAVSQEAAVAMLQGKGFTPISIEQEKQTPQLLKDLQHIWEGIGARELAVFFRQLATLIEAKVTIVSSLRAVSDQTDNAYFRTVIKEMVDDIEDGAPLSEAMSKHPDVFENLAVSMVKAGELSGNLQRSILFLADNTEKNYELSSKIKGALFYPIFILVVAAVIGMVVSTIVLPKLTNIFKGMDLAIPWYTQVLMVVGDFMSAYWWMVLILIVAVIAGVTYYLSTEDGKREWDMLKMKIPVIGSLFQFVYISRFAENLAVLLNGGIPIVRALIIVSEVVNSTAFEGVILRAADEVKTGGSMSNVFGRSTLFPPIVSQMIKIGEDAGKIGDVLKQVSKFYNKETDRITRNLSTLVEPVLMVILGLGVAVLVFAIMIPIYNMSAAM